MQHILRQSKAILFTLGPVEFIQRTQSYIAMKLFGVKAYQKPLTRSIKRLAKNHPSFIDIGAASGDIVEVAEPWFKKVIVIEPAPHHLKELHSRKSMGRLGKAVIVQDAVGHKNGKAKLGFSETNPDDNSLFQREELSNYIEVKVKTIDKIIKEMKLPKPVAIKIDVQGFEGHFFKGAEELLDSGCAIIMEFWPWGLHEAGTKPEKLISDIRKKGYQIHKLSGRKYPNKRLQRMAIRGLDNRLIVDDLLVLPKA